MNGLMPLLKLLRPHQWVKSGFVFVGLLFGHVWYDGALVQSVLFPVAAFSLAASAVYVLNDLADRRLFYIVGKDNGFIVLSSKLHLNASPYLFFGR